MSGPPVIRHNSEIVRVGEEGQPDVHAAGLVPGKWRRMTMRLGGFEFGYASVKIAPNRPLVRDSYHPAPRRTGFSGRLVEHLGLTVVALMLLGGLISVLAIRSDAFVAKTANQWPIVDARAGGAAAQQNPADAVKAAVPDKERPTPVPAAVTLQPSILRAAIRDGLAELVRKGEMQGAAAMPSAAVAQAPAGEGDSPRVAAMAGALDRIPAVAAAIKRAMATGEVQNWTATGLEGVVVVGQGYQKGDAVCREGSILARDGGPESKTQTFERCSKGA